MVCCFRYSLLLVTWRDTDCNSPCTAGSGSTLCLHSVVWGFYH